MSKIVDVLLECPKEKCDNYNPFSFYDNCSEISCLYNYSKFKPVTEKTLQIRKLKQQIQDLENID